MPPSKAKGDPDYDDRTVQIANIFCQGTGAIVREILVRTVNIDAMHTQTTKRDIQKLYDTMKIDENTAVPPPLRIGILDDVLTTGASFVAASRRLRDQFPQTTIV